MRGTEGYTGRYVWKLSVLFDLGRKRRGAAAPCIHWEDPVLNMASGVCKAYIRGALASDWFWNKFSRALQASQAKVVLASNGSPCLTSARSSWTHVGSSRSLTSSGRSFVSARELASPRSHTRHTLWGLTWRSPLCLQIGFGRRLSIRLLENPSWSESLHSFPIYMSHGSMNALGALLRLRRPLCYLRSIHRNGNESQSCLSIAWEWNAHTTSQQEMKATEVGLCNQVGFVHKNGTIIFMLQFKCTDTHLI